MDKIEILNTLEEVYGTSNPQEVPEPDRAILFENFRSKISCTKDPNDYTQQLILISETLEL